MENPIKMDDLGVPWSTTIFGNTHIYLQLPLPQVEQLKSEMASWLQTAFAVQLFLSNFAWLSMLKLGVTRGKEQKLEETTMHNQTLQDGPR